MIKVFGHISPDTDTVGCAILWAWYLNSHKALKASPFALGPINKETAFVLKRWSIEEPALLETLNKGDEVVIVDTNNPGELPSNILEAEILQIIDHHRLIGGLSTKSPIELNFKPLASTATVIFDIMNLQVEELPESIKGVMLSCILSDTLGFRSPTTTPHDKDVAEKLASNLNIEINKYADELLKAKSDMSDLSDLGLIHIDSKKLTLGDKNLRISVVETTDAPSVISRKDGIISAIKNLLSEEKDTNDILFFIVDILKEESTVLTYNDFTKNIIEKSFEVAVESDTKVLPGVISRKKQIIPVLKIA